MRILFFFCIFAENFKPMYTLEQIDSILADSESQQKVSQLEWKEMRDALAVLLADKPVSLLKYRRQIDALRKIPLKRHTEGTSQQKSEPSKPIVVSRSTVAEGKTICRVCGAPLAASGKNVLEHYEKKHYSEYVHNKAIMTAKPYIFVTTKK